MKLKHLALLMVMVLLMFTTACSSSAATVAAADATTAPATAATTAAPATEKKTFTIALSTKTITNNEFQRVAAEAAQKAVEAAGYKFELVLAGGEMEVSAQVNNIEDLINKGVDGILLFPMDGQAVIPALQKAKAAGIPVILADVGITKGNDDLYATLIGTENYGVGKTAAAEMVKAIGEGEVIMVRGASGAMGGELRASGFRDGLKGTKVTLVNEQAGDWQSEVAMKATENMLSSNPKTKGVFLCSDGMLPGVISAVDNAGQTGKISIISVDGNLSAVKEIEAGRCYGTVGQYPGKIGQLAAENMIQILEGKLDPAKMEKFTDSGFLFMSKANLDEAYKFAY